MYNQTYNTARVVNIICMPAFVDFVEAGKHQNFSHGSTYGHGDRWDVDKQAWIKFPEDPDRIDFWRAQITLCPEQSGEVIRVGDQIVYKTVYASTYKQDLLKTTLKTFKKGHCYVWGEVRDRYPSALKTYPGFEHLLLEMDIKGFVDNPEGKFPSLLRAYYEGSMR
jgi:hypothetical protein